MIRQFDQIQIKISFTLAILVTLIITFGSSGVTLAQSPITAHVEPTRLSIDDQFTLNVTVSGDFLTIPNPDLSQLQDFVVVSSSTSTQVSIVNGQMSSQKIFLYRLKPLIEGKQLIGPISVNIGGNIYQTDPIEIEVFGSNSQILPPGEDVPDTTAPDTLEDQNFFIEAEVDNPTPYLGEQIIYTFRLYQAVNFLRQPDYEPPDFTDFWSSEILSQPHYNTEANGRQYLVSEIRTALFPANLGSLIIEPSTLIIPGAVFNPDIQLETNPVEVEVRPLPEGAPEDFSGVVGQYDIKASLSESEAKVNEPVTLLVEIEGTGNIQTLTEPSLPELPGWRIFESQATTTIETDEDVVRGLRRYERLVVPGQPGEQTFPAISFSYYDPDAKAYQTISSDPIPITILPDESAQALPPIIEVGEDGKVSVERISADIRHIKPVPTALSTAESLSSIVWLFYGCGWLLPVLIVGGVQIWQRKQRRLRQDVAYARDVRAQRVALNILAEAQQQDATNDANAAGRALLGYLSDKLNTPTAGLTTNDLINLLNESRLDATLIDRTQTLLHQIDIGRFAPITAGRAGTIIADTQQLINDLEKSFGRRR